MTQDETLIKLLALKRFTEDKIQNLISWDEDKKQWIQDYKPVPEQEETFTYEELELQWQRGTDFGLTFEQWLNKNFIITRKPKQ